MIRPKFINAGKYLSTDLVISGPKIWKDTTDFRFLIMEDRDNYLNYCNCSIITNSLTLSVVNENK